MNPLSICFALCSVMGFLSVWRVWKDKHIAGVSILPAFVYGSTNLFEVGYFYQQASYWTAVGAFLMFAANALWLSFVIFYMARAAAKGSSDWNHDEPAVIVPLVA